MQQQYILRTQLCRTIVFVDEMHLRKQINFFMVQSKYM